LVRISKKCLSWEKVCMYKHMYVPYQNRGVIPFVMQQQGNSYIGSNTGLISTTHHPGLGPLIQA